MPQGQKSRQEDTRSCLRGETCLRSKVQRGAHCLQQMADMQRDALFDLVNSKT